MSKINESIYSRCSFINLKIKLNSESFFVFFYLDTQRDQQKSSHKKKKRKKRFSFFSIVNILCNRNSL
jgi:hypothetical protein